MRSKIEALHRYQRFSIFAVSCTALLVGTFGLYAVLLCQGIAGFVLANSASTHAVWMLALTTLVVAIVTYVVSYAVYAWV